MQNSLENPGYTNHSSVFQSILGEIEEECRIQNQDRE